MSLISSTFLLTLDTNVAIVNDMEETPMESLAKRIITHYRGEAKFQFNLQGVQAARYVAARSVGKTPHEAFLACGGK